MSRIRQNDTDSEGEEEEKEKKRNTSKHVTGRNLQRRLQPTTPFRHPPAPLQNKLKKVIVLLNPRHQCFFTIIKFGATMFFLSLIIMILIKKKNPVKRHSQIRWTLIARTKTFETQTTHAKVFNQRQNVISKKHF